MGDENGVIGRQEEEKDTDRLSNRQKEKMRET